MFSRGGESCGNGVGGSLKEKEEKKGTFQKYFCPGRHLLVCSFPFFFLFFVYEVQSIPMRFYAGFNCCVGFSLEPVGCLSFAFLSFLFF